MNFRHLLFLVLLAGSAIVRGTEVAPTTGTTPADVAWAEFDAWARPDAPLPESLKSAPKGRALEWQSQRQQHVRETGVTFLARFPSDARYWKVMDVLLRRTFLFIAQVKPEYEDIPVAKNLAELGPLARRREAAMVRDLEASLAWEKRRAELLVEVVTRSDAPVELKAYAASLDIDRMIRAGRQAMRDASEPGRLVFDPALRPRLEQQVVQFPTAHRPMEQVQWYMQLVGETGDTDRIEADWRAFAASPYQPLADVAAENLRLISARRVLSTLQFRAIDGREVDLAKLRGKVVLVDFWATWCGPCKEEIPTVVAAYQKYHEQGFEVIGISLDENSGRQTLLDYIAAHGMSWPQHFDGQGWKNQFAVKFGIQGIPAMFLLDQEGRLVSTNARGPMLELEVRRLLKL